jgi:hypothetical protein
VADTKISALTAVTTPTLADEFACNQGGASKKVTLETLAAWQAAPILAILAADYTLTSSTTAQKLFNNSTNGAVTIPTGIFWMEYEGVITGMSATSGNGQFQLGGTATLANPRLLHSYGLDATTLTTAAAQGGAWIQGATAFVTNTTTAATGTGWGFAVRGIFACTAGGTIIPQIALTTAAAAVHKAGSIFTLERLGGTSDTLRGSWS